MILLGKVQCGYDDVDTLLGKAIHIPAWTNPEGSRRLRLPEFLNNQHMKVCQSHAPAAFTPQEAESRIKSMQNLNEPIGNRTRDLPDCSAVPQPTTPPTNITP
jgi:hypothetical protein